MPKPNRTAPQTANAAGGGRRTKLFRQTKTKPYIIMSEENQSPILPEAPKTVLPEAPKTVLPEAPKAVLPEAPKPTVAAGAPAAARVVAPKPAVAVSARPAAVRPATPQPVGHTRSDAASSAFLAVEFAAAVVSVAFAILIVFEM